MALAKAVQWILLGLAGVGTVYAAAQWTRNPDGAAVDASPVNVRTKTSLEKLPPQRLVAAEASAAAVRPASATAPQAAWQPLVPATRSVPESPGDAFAKLSWLPPEPPPAPAPPPAAPPKPPAPTAPPLPFSFVGMVEKGAGKPRAFLARGDALLIVEAGDVLEGNTYRVDALGPSQVSLTYLPLNLQQSIDIAGASK